MDFLLEAYGDDSDTPPGSDKHNVKFYEDVLTDGDSDEFSKEKALKDAKFDEALLKFYISNKVKQLKRRLTASRIEKVQLSQFKKQKTESHEQTVFTRYSGKYFSTVAKSLTPHQVAVIDKYGAGCFLKFEKTDVPLRFVKWIAGKFDTRTSEIQLRSNFIPVTKDTVHNILEIPNSGLEVVPDREAGRSFILSHFNVTSIPQVSFFGKKLKSEENLSDEDILICFMIVLFQSFLCPNSSLQPSTEYLHLFRDVANIMKYDLCKFVYDWLVSSIKKFRKAVKVSAKRQITLGGNHYILAVAYLDRVDFGLKSLPDVVPRVLVWKGTRIRDYADLDKCSGNSFGKRPLKHVSYASKVQSKEPQYSQSTLPYLHDSSGRRQFKHVSYASKVQPEEPEHSQHRVSENFRSNIQTAQPSFIDKLSSLLGPCLDTKQLKTVAEVVKLNTVGNPVEIEQKCEEIVCQVLKGLYVGNQNIDLHTSTNKAVPNATSKCSEPLISSPSFKIDPDDKALSNKDETDFDFSISRGKLASGKYQELAKRLNARGNVFQAADNFDFSNSGTCYKSNYCSNNEVQHVPNVQTVKNDGNTQTISNTIPPCHIDILDSQELAPDPKIKDNVIILDASNSPISDAVMKQPSGNETTFQSPIIPRKLTDVFSEQKSKLKAKTSFGIPSKCASNLFLLKKNSIDLTSPVCSNSNVVLLDDSPDSLACQITGQKYFKDRCNTLSKEANDAYNKLVSVTNLDKADNTYGHSQVQETIQISQSPEGKQVDTDLSTQVRPSAQNLGLNQVDTNIPGSSSKSNNYFVPTRRIVPGRYNSDPFVSTQSTRYPLLPSERRYYSAICYIGNHNEWKKLEAVKYEKSFCSFQSLATLQPYGHIDNYLVLVYCRKLFMDHHPRYSKKHTFFSYVGEAIYKYNEKNGDVVQHAFQGANSAYPMWRSNQLSFPLCIGGHWFVFAVCFKAKMFAFCDSLYTENSSYHQTIDHVLLEKFVHLWDIFVTPIMPYQINFNEYQIVYPRVPRQTNPDDCGVVAVKILDVWHPRAQLQNIFSSNDILNIRIKLANEIYFSKHNKVDKTVVSEFFGDVGLK